MRRLFGGRPVGAIAVVETPVSISYARKARITFRAARQDVPEALMART